MTRFPARRLPARLLPGDHVVVVSPASWPDSHAGLDPLLSVLLSWGPHPRTGAHVADRRGYLAGTDADRLADVNEALRDRTVRALIASLGGCGSLRLVHGLDRAALEEDPKPLVGYSDITALHQVWRRSGVPVVHGAVDGAHRDAVRGVGVVDVSWEGCLLLLEANKAAGLGMVDRALTQLRASGALDGVTGVAVGSFEEFTGYQDRGWTVLDVLHDLLDDLGVPPPRRTPARAPGRPGPRAAGRSRRPGRRRG